MYISDPDYQRLNQIVQKGIQQKKQEDSDFSPKRCSDIAAVVDEDILHTIDHNIQVVVAAENGFKWNVCKGFKPIYPLDDGTRTECTHPTTVVRVNGEYAPVKPEVLSHLAKHYSDQASGAPCPACLTDMIIHYEISKQRSAQQ